MSFYGSLGSAVQGIIAQATAIGHISENVAHSTTIGYKQVNTLFSDLVNNKVTGDSSLLDSNRNMGVLAYADFANRRQGTIIRDGSTTSIAVNGNGFIPVAKPTGIDSATGTPDGFEAATYYTRLGDFRLDNSNRLVNSAGYYLLAAPPGNSTQLSDFVVDDSDIPAVPTSQVTFQANFPANANTGTSFINNVPLIDANSNEQPLQLHWTKTALDTWELEIQSNGNPLANPITFTFNNGVLESVNNGVTTTTGPGNLTITLDPPPDFGAGPQPLSINFGEFGATYDVNAIAGVTQYTVPSEQQTNVNLTQNGLKGGEFSSVSIDGDGNIIYNYTNSRSRIGGQLLLANFPEPDRLDRVDGTAFLQTRVSGAPAFGIPGDTNNEAGVGDLIAGALEQSNVDVSEQMTRLIVAQQAYSMNGQVLTASDEMMSRAIDMKR